MKNKYLVPFIAFASMCLPAFALAHSVVSPSQTVPSKYETFTLGVPTEKDIPTTAVRLEMPAGVDRVTPIVKPGWTIKTKKDASGNVTEISWTGGSIPAGQKDMFVFSARTSASSTVLVWKAYQTYRDGTVVAWDRNPASAANGEKVDNPYSTTKVEEVVPVKKSSDSTSLTFSIVAIALSVVALVVARKNRHEH